MKTPKFMNASFEEGLNLEDDPYIRDMEKDTRSRRIYTGKNKIGFILASIFALDFNSMFPLFIKYAMEEKLGPSTLPTPTINLLPMLLFFLFFCLWAILWLLSKYKNYRSISMYRRIFNCNTFLIWLFIDCNLFFATMLLTSLTILGVLLLSMLTGYAGYIIFRTRSIKLTKQLFDIEKNQTKLDQFNEKIRNFWFKYWWILIIIVNLWNYFIPHSEEMQTNIFVIIEVLFVWIAANIAFLAAEAYLFLPYLLYGYYKAKYPEEYREWEGKTQLEWYGKRYFNKYIKGTKKEVREC